MGLAFSRRHARRKSNRVLCRFEAESKAEPLRGRHAPRALTNAKSTNSTGVPSPPQPGGSRIVKTVGLNSIRVARLAPSGGGCQVTSLASRAGRQVAQVYNSLRESG